MFVLHQKVNRSALPSARKTLGIVLFRGDLERTKMTVGMERALAFVLHTALAQVVEVAYHIHNARRILDLLDCLFVNHNW